MARKYQHTIELLPQIKKMQARGIPKQRGRKPAKTLAEYKHENHRLKMEAVFQFPQYRRRGITHTWRDTLLF